MIASNQPERRDGDVTVSHADVSAIVVAYGAVPILREAVRSLESTGVGEVIVWDNSILPEDQAGVRSLGGGIVRVLTSGENLGFGKGNNAAAKAANGKYLLLVNPDCEVSAECVARLRGLMEDPSIGVAAPRMVYPNGSFGFPGGGSPSMLKEVVAATRLDDLLPEATRLRLLGLFEACFGNVGRGMSESLKEGPYLDLAWVSGFCMMLRAETFAQIGGFDPRFFLYFEDVDLSERLRKIGLRAVVARDVEALHRESSTTHGKKSEHYWNGLATYWAVRDAGLRSRLSRLLARAASRS